MSYSPYNAYRYNPLMDTPAQQISFLFGKLHDYINTAEDHRASHEYEQFAHITQKAISVIHGLSSFLQEELPEEASKSWDVYFLKLLYIINQNSLHPEHQYKNILMESMHEMQQLWREMSIKSISALDVNNASSQSFTHSLV